MKKILVLAAAVAVASVWGTTKVEAAPILMSATFQDEPGPPNTGTDCAGVFGTPSTPCDVGFEFGVEISPFIVKFHANGEVDAINPEFDTIDGDEFTFGSGSWTYTPTGDDPAVRFWVAKGGSAFNLFWYVEGTGAGGDEIPAACATPYSVACLSLALSVTGGTYTVPGTAGLSHITFYDTGGLPPCPDCDPVVPEPASLLLFGTGLAALAVRLRRRKTA